MKPSIVAAKNACCWRRRHRSTSLGASPAWAGCDPGAYQPQANGLIAVLGCLTDTIEILRFHPTSPPAVIAIPQIARYPLIQDGDAHFLTISWGERIHHSKSDRRGDWLAVLGRRPLL
jgi:hypothetical protein